MKLTGPEAIPPLDERLHRAADLREVDPRAGAALEDDPLLGVPVEDRLHRVLDREDEAGRALLVAVLAPPDVEPHRAVEGRLLVEQDVGQLGLEGVGVLVGGEVAALAPPGGDPPGDAGDHLLDGALALRRAEPAAEVLLGDDVGRVLRPALRELDPALLERGALGIADHRVAELPLDLVEGVDAGGGEAALDRQSRLASLCVLCSGFSHQVLSSKRLSGGTPHPRARPDGTGRRPGWPGTSRIRHGRQSSGELQVGAPSRARGAPSRQSSPIRSRGELAARRRRPSISIRRRSPRGRTAMTGRLWAARSSAARSFVRSNRWRSPSRLITYSGSGSRRSKVVNRWPQREHSRRRRTAPPSAARRLSSTRVGDWQLGQTTQSILLAMVVPPSANARCSVLQCVSVRYSPSLGRRFARLGCDDQTRSAPRSGSPTPRSRPPSRAGRRRRDRCRRADGGRRRQRPPSGSPTRKTAADEFIARQKPRLRGVSHEWAFFVSLVAGAALVIAAPTRGRPLAVAIYAGSLSALLGTSALYHRVNWRRPEIRRWMRRLDHSMIFLLIAGTVTPFALLVIDGALGDALLIAVWAGRRRRDRRRAGLGRGAEVGHGARLPLGRLDRRCSASRRSWSRRDSAPAC